MTIALLDPPAPTEVATRRQLLTGAAGLLALGLAGGDSEAATGPATRLVRHELDPRRIVVYDRDYTLGALLSVGVTPIAAASFVAASGEDHPAVLGDLTDGIEPLDFSSEITIEKIASLRPDLIIGAYADEGVFRQLSQIAPTVQFADIPGGADASHRQVAAVVGRERQWDEGLAEFEQEVRDAAKTLSDPGSVSFTLLFGDTLEPYDTKDHKAPQIAQMLGAQVVDLDPIREQLDLSAYIVLPIERIGILSGDSLVLLQIAGSEEDSAGLTQVQELEIYQNLPAVRAGRVLTLDRLTASGVGGLFAYRYILEELVRFFQDVT